MTHGVSRHGAAADRRELQGGAIGGADDQQIFFERGPGGWAKGPERAGQGVPARAGHGARLRGSARNTPEILSDQSPWTGIPNVDGGFRHDCGRWARRRPPAGTSGWRTAHPGPPKKKPVIRSVAAAGSPGPCVVGRLHRGSPSRASATAIVDPAPVAVAKRLLRRRVIAGSSPGGVLRTTAIREWACRGHRLIRPGPGRGLDEPPPKRAQTRAFSIMSRK